LIQKDHYMMLLNIILKTMQADVKNLFCNEQRGCAAFRFPRMDPDPLLSGSIGSRLRRTALFLGEGRLNPPFCGELSRVYSISPSAAVLAFSPPADLPGGHGIEISTPG